MLLRIHHRSPIRVRFGDRHTTCKSESESLLQSPAGAAEGGRVIGDSCGTRVRVGSAAFATRAKLQKSTAAKHEFSNAFPARSQSKSLGTPSNKLSSNHTFWSRSCSIPSKNRQRLVTYFRPVGVIVGQHHGDDSPFDLPALWLISNMRVALSGKLVTPCKRNASNSRG